VPDPARRAIQDHYPEDCAHCFGCGRLNACGYRLKTFVEGEETVTRFTPGAEHTALPGFVYGGLIASLLDCHATATGAAAAERAAGREIGAAPAPRFVTASLKVDYVKPTPLGPELVIRGRVARIEGRKVFVEATLSADAVITARAEALVVQVPEGMRRQHA
jgi:acyl-coenzyme A thioesterase PaaI-like protein